jgi:hypothetical protein
MFRESPPLTASQELLKLALILLIMVPGSVEDERVFSTWSSIETDLRSRLQEEHLNLVTRMFLQKWWNVHDQLGTCFFRIP